MFFEVPYTSPSLENSWLRLWNWLKVALKCPKKSQPPFVGSKLSKTLNCRSLHDCTKAPVINQDVFFKKFACMQRRIEDPVEHLRWSFFAIIVNREKPLIVFAKKLYCRWCDWVLNTTPSFLQKINFFIHILTGDNLILLLYGTLLSRHWYMKKQ